MTFLKDALTVAPDFLWPIKSFFWGMFAFVGLFLIIALCVTYFTGLAAFITAYTGCLTFLSLFIAFMDKVHGR